jgi:hypothetical protein
LVSLVFDMDGYKKLNFDVDYLCQPVYKLILKKNLMSPDLDPSRPDPSPPLSGHAGVALEESAPPWRSLRRLGGACAGAVLEEPIGAAV